MGFLKNHPFPVVAKFDRVVALSFAFREEVLGSLIPEGLVIDSYEGFGFVTLALVWTCDLRPAGFPKMLGRDFFLAGYRIFTRLSNEGRALRGLKIIRSETDSRFMVLSGNLMTGYNYRRVHIEISTDANGTNLLARRPNGDQSFKVDFDSDAIDVQLPDSSPFPDWRTARRFAGPMPFTFSPMGGGSFVVVEGSRDRWKPKAVKVNKWEIELFDEAPFHGSTPILANAFEVRDIEYRWEKGRVVQAGGER